MKKNILILSLALLTQTPSYAFDFSKFFSDVVNSIFTSPGSKSSNSSGSGASVAFNSLPKDFKKPGACSLHYPWGVPRLSDSEKENSLIFICSPSFALAYSPQNLVSTWSSEVIQSNNVEQSETLSASVKVSYAPSSLIDPSLQASNKDYVSSEYKKLHFVAPNNQYYDTNATKESFAYTNIAPIHAKNLIWLELEQWVSSQAKMRGTLYVTSGSLFLNPQVQLLNSKVAIPSHFFKIVIDPKINEAISFVIPNKEVYSIANSTPSANAHSCKNGVCSIFDFTTSIEEVERVAKIKIIPNIETNNVVRKKVSDDFISTRRYGAALYR